MEELRRLLDDRHSVQSLLNAEADHSEHGETAMFDLCQLHVFPLSAQVHLSAGVKRGGGSQGHSQAEVAWIGGVGEAVDAEVGHEMEEM